MEATSLVARHFRPQLAELLGHVAPHARLVRVDSERRSDRLDDCAAVHWMPALQIQLGSQASSE